MTADLPVFGLLAASAALFCSLLVPLSRKLAVAMGAVDLPDERRVHRVPTPRLGGVAVFLAVMITLAGAVAVGAVSSSRASLVPFIAGALLVLAVGLADDVRRLRPHVKLAVELVAAAVVVYAGDVRIQGVSGPGGGVLFLGWLAGPLTVVWIVLVTNAMNLIDGIDGLAAGSAAISFVTVGVIAMGFGYHAIAGLAGILAGACLGFLVFNSHPASIFLGDSGSLFLGFSLGVLSSQAGAKGTTGAITLATLLIVAFPIGDMLLAVQRRYMRGLSPGSVRSHVAGLGRIFQPDRNHLHHRLLRAGLGQRGAAFALYAIQVIACAYAVYLLVRR
jgi:UDP-GlcNAc:undecaprenyl-phosphate GlcNAc-1-phosphate transferase